MATVLESVFLRDVQGQMILMNCAVLQFKDLL